MYPSFLVEFEVHAPLKTSADKVAPVKFKVRIGPPNFQSLNRYNSDVDFLFFFAEILYVSALSCLQRPHNDLNPFAVNIRRRTAFKFETMIFLHILRFLVASFLDIG